MKTVYTVYRMDGRTVFVTDPARVSGPRGRRVEFTPMVRYFSCLHCDNMQYVDFFDIALRALVGDI